MPTDYYRKLLQNNRDWVEESLAKDPEFFNRLANGQKPPVLWIGCSDSRVPANQITGTLAGEVFVHRNIANMVVHTDLNLLSVLQYAVEYLKVDHIIVCGHYGCGGVQAAMTPQNYGLLNLWLRNIMEVEFDHKEELALIPDEKTRMRQMVEWNTVAQVKNLAKTSIIQQAWQDRQGPSLHGWVYDVGDGLVKDLVQIDNRDAVDPIFHYNFDAPKK